jgi:GT2 family glycosyltransferase
VKPKIVVSVVSGARSELILGFLRSLRSTTDIDGSDIHVVAIVNRTDPDLTRRIEADDRAVEIVENTSPRGFAANHNEVMHRIHADYYLIANDDVVVLDDAVHRLLGFMEEPQNSRVAVVSPRLVGLDGAVQPSTYSFPSVSRILLSISGLRGRAPVAASLRLAARLPRFRAGRSSYWAHDETRMVDTLAGAFVLVRGAAVREVGLMDEVSLAGGEETEWHKRMADRGWSVAFFPEAEVMHVGSQTVSRTASIELEYARGWFNYTRKHGSGADRAALRFGAAAIYGSRWVWASVRGDASARRLAVSALRLTRDLRTR